MGNLERVATAIPFELKPMEIPADASKVKVDSESPKTKPNDFQESKISFTQRSSNNSRKFSSQ